MADWTTITDTQVDPKAPVTSELMTALRDNPIAIAQGATGATKIELAAMAHAGAVGAIGTYAFLVPTGGDTDYSAGSTLAGTSLRYAGVQYNNASTSWATIVLSGTPDGTWRCMGYSLNTPNYNPPAPDDLITATLWLRIS